MDDLTTNDASDLFPACDASRTSIERATQPPARHVPTAEEHSKRMMMMKKKGHCARIESRVTAD